MLILTSNGLSSEKLISEIKKYIGEKRTAAVVTTASIGYKENDWHIPRITSELQSLGLDVTCIDLEFESPERLADFDVVEIIGGNPFFLLKHIKKWGMDSFFEELADRKIIIGISAGSSVLQKSIDLVAQYNPEMNDEVGLNDFTGLCLTNCEVLPHYNKYLSRYKRFEERAKEYENEHNISLFRIDDGQALFVTKNQIYIV